MRRQRSGGSWVGVGRRENVREREREREREVGVVDKSEIRAM